MLIFLDQAGVLIAVASRCNVWREADCRNVDRINRMRLKSRVQHIRIGDDVRLCQMPKLRWKLRQPWWLCSTLSVMLVLAGMGQACAKAPEITVTTNLPLRFGTLLVPASGSRTVSSRGQITDSGVFTVGNDPVGPAQFTVTYDRGNESRRSLTIKAQVFLSGNQRFKAGGVEGQLSQLESDIGGSFGFLTDGQIYLTIDDCRERRCSVTFTVGARLTVSRSVGGANLVVPFSASATVLAVF